MNFTLEDWCWILSVTTVGTAIIFFFTVRSLKIDLKYRIKQLQDMDKLFSEKLDIIQKKDNIIGNLRDTERKYNQLVEEEDELKASIANCTYFNVIEETDTDQYMKIVDYFLERILEDNNVIPKKQPRPVPKKSARKI